MASLEYRFTSGAIDVLRIAGPAPPWMQFGRTFELTRDDRGAAISIVMHEANGDVSFQWLERDSLWQALASRNGLEDVRPLQELEALALLGADLIVIVSDVLTRVCDLDSLRSLNLMTPEEAMLVIGVWSRTVHKAFIGPMTVNNGLYYWRLAGILNTAARRTRKPRTTRRAGPAVDDGERMGSTVDNSKMMLRTLDRLLATWQCEANNDTLDEMLDDFAYIVMAAWTIHDSLAIIAGRSLEIDLRPPRSPKWNLLNEQWRAAVRQKANDDGAAVEVLRLLDRYRPSMEALRLLRNEFAHRPRDRMVQFQHQGDPDEGLLPIQGELLSALERHLGNTPEGLLPWGLGPILERSEVMATDINTGLQSHLTEPRRAFLDVVPFAIRVTAYTARLANEIHGVLFPSAYARKTIGRLKHPTIAALDELATRKNSRHTVATSGVAELANWTVPDGESG
jgi:hypothetical protein